MRRYSVTVNGRPFSVDIEETAADRFLVTVGDRTYEAALEAAEDLPGTTVTPGLAAVTPPAAAPVERGPATAAGTGPGASGMVAPVAGRASGPPDGSRSAAADGAGATAGGASVIAAPMPGVVLEVHVVPGARVRRGDPLLVLEAMKMRNTIRSPRDGEVISVPAEAGRPVLPGEPLVHLADAAT